MMLVLVAEGGGRMVEEAEKRWGMADGAEAEEGFQIYVACCRG
jgi:hypothetical protein